LTAAQPRGKIPLDPARGHDHYAHSPARASERDRAYTLAGGRAGEHTQGVTTVAKKKRTSLPRVTVMAYSKRDLVAFVQSVENLRLLVDDLRVILATKVKAKKPQPVVADATHHENGSTN
jgi:hypothetical protein